VLAAVAGAVAGVLATGSGGSRQRAGTTGAQGAGAVNVAGQSSGGTHRLPFGGRLLVVNPAGHLASAQPSGPVTDTFPRLGNFQQQPPAASPDGRMLAGANGDLVAVDGGHPRPAHGNVSASFTYLTSMPGQPFADSNRYVVAMQPNANPRSLAPHTVQAVPVGQGHPVDLGVGAAAAGDPRSLGAFVIDSVAGPVSSSGVERGQPDADVELRQSGRHPVVLATTSQLLEDVAAPAGTLVLLDPVVSPDGDYLAVTVLADQRGTFDGGLVLMDRAGKVMATAIYGVGPASDSASPAWSPDSRTVAYVTNGSRGDDLGLLGVSQSTLTQPLATGQPVSRCVWSPDSAAVLCSTATVPGTGRAPQWLVALTHGGFVYQFTGAGYPLAWLPG
jgi:hypothetical protein